MKNIFSWSLPNVDKSMGISYEALHYFENNAAINYSQLIAEF